MTINKRLARSTKLLLVCGPTGTGKTKLGLELAKKFDGEVISADSRQVYKLMDVVTGKDVPKNFRSRISDLRFKNRPIPFFSNGKVSIWGYDLIRPDEEWSVKLFQDFVHIVIAHIYKRGKLPIVVGGTGLYLKSLTEPMPLISIPRNEVLRKDLEKKSVQDLYVLLEATDPVKALSMNNSDRQNPRRLVRALEIVNARQVSSRHTSVSPLPSRNVLWVGLTSARRSRLYQRIDQRVNKRIGSLLFRELELLSKKNYLCRVPSQTIGYQQWIKYIDGKINKEEAIQRWKFAEQAYARRQLTWFKKQPQIQWFDMSVPNASRNIVSRVRQWYDENDARVTTS